MKNNLNTSSAKKMLKQVRPLYIFPPKMSAYSRDFDGIKYMSFLIKNDEFLKKYIIEFGKRLKIP